MNNLSQNYKNELVGNIKNEIFHKIYVRNVSRGVMNGKNLGPPTEAQCHYTECHNLNNNCSNGLKSYPTTSKIILTIPVCNIWKCQSLPYASSLMKEDCHSTG